MFTRKFWKDTLERVVSSAVQGALVGWVGTDVLGQDWNLILGSAGGMAVLTLLKCVAASRMGETDSASLLPADEG